MSFPLTLLGQNSIQNTEARSLATGAVKSGFHLQDSKSHIPISGDLSGLGSRIEVASERSLNDAHFKVRVFPTVIHRACRQTRSAGCMSAGPNPSVPLYEREMPMT